MVDGEKGVATIHFDLYRPGYAKVPQEIRKITARVSEGLLATIGAVVSNIEKRTAQYEFSYPRLFHSFIDALKETLEKIEERLATARESLKKTVQDRETFSPQPTPLSNF